MGKCKTEIIYKTDHGYVLACTCCQDVQIGFGNMMLVYRMDGFKRFRDYINSVDPSTVYFDSPIDKCIYIKMQDIGFGYCLSKEEILELRELLNTSWDIMQLKEMVAEALE